MKEAGNKILSDSDGSAVISIFPCNEVNKDNDIIPWADVFICRALTTTPDSNVIILDVHPDITLSDIKHPGSFEAYTKIATKFRKCKILISQNEIDFLKKHHYTYKYGRVRLVTDDYD